MAAATSIPESATAFIKDLSTGLQQNLYSVVVYGSLVRGGYDASTSDINLLIILEVSTPEAHIVISEALGNSKANIDPFVLTRQGIDRSFRAFATKFDSIKRHYKVLHGADPLESYQPDPDLARFLSEQTIRNLRLRSVQAFVHWRKDARQYMRYLERTIPVIITDLSELLRQEDIDIPNSFDERAPIIAREYKVEESGLKNLLDIAHHPRKLKSDEILKLHRFVFSLLDTAVTKAVNADA